MSLSYGDFTRPPADYAIVNIRQRVSPGFKPSWLFKLRCRVAETITPALPKGVNYQVIITPKGKIKVRPDLKVNPLPTPPMMDFARDGVS